MRRREIARALRLPVGPAAPSRGVEPRRILAVTGGKGGVGKSTIAVNLAAWYAQRGARVLLVDGDFGMADLNLLLGIAPERTVLDLLAGRRIERVLVEAHGVSVVPGLNGSLAAAHVGRTARDQILRSIAEVADRFDTFILDSAAGLGDDAIGLVQAAAETLVVCTPDPLSLANAYACLKVLNQRGGLARALLLPNAVRSAEEADDTVARLQELSTRFLGIELIPLPAIPYDSTVPAAGASGTPSVLLQPDAPASRAVGLVAARIDQLCSVQRNRDVLARWAACTPAPEMRPGTNRRQGR